MSIRNWRSVSLVAAVFLSALALYVASGAPSVVSGDQAEHQFTAWIIGVPHATGYPLFTMLNALGARLLPFGDVARRVTLMVALYSACAVTLAYLVGRRMSGSRLAGLLTALVIATAPEFWQLATFAEVYTLQVAFILGVLLALLRWWRIEATEPGLGLERRGLRHPLALASLLAGLGATHHGSFIPVVAPALLLTVAGPIFWRLRDPAQRGMAWRLIGRCLGWAALGFTPWLYLVVQYAAFHPFDYYRGTQPYHLYWGNPASWGDVANLALGAGFRLKVFTHAWGRLDTLLPGYLAALRDQFWWTGSVLGVVGAGVTWRRFGWRGGLWTTLVWLGGSWFGLNVAADVPKAHVYYLPAWIMWGLWIGLGAHTLAMALVQLVPFVRDHPQRRAWLYAAPLVLVLVLVLVRSGRRYPHISRSGAWAHREIGSAILDAVEPDAVILCRWEDCMTLRYLQFVEGTKLGVQLDQTEPEAGINWAERVPIYPDQPVYAVRFNPQLAERYPVEPVERVPEEMLWKVRTP